jgi:hypothetical protein
MPAPILKFFAYEHLPAKLQEVSKPIGDLARDMDEKLPDGAEKSTGLRKLLEAKDALVRAALPAILLVALTGCSALGLSSLDGPGTQANLANVKSLVAENDGYTAADASLPPSLKATRTARNTEALKLAENLAGSAK